MRKSLFAAAVLASLGAASVAPASAAPGMIGAVEAPATVTEVRMDGMHGHRLMGRHHHRGHRMMRHGHHHHMMGHGHRRGHMMGHHHSHRM